MKRHMKKLLIALAIGMGLAASSHAVGSSDTITVTIRPNAYYAVTITTGDVVMDLGTVNLGASTQTVRPATVTVQSTYASTDLMLRGDIQSPGAGDWTFDASSASLNANELAAWATFTSLARTSAPAQTGSYFNCETLAGTDCDLIAAANRYVGSSAGNSTSDLYEATGEADDFEMDSLSVNEQSHLWLYFRLPSASDDNDPQYVTITLTGTAPN
jgi:hypothetical protein